MGGFYIQTVGHNFKAGYILENIEGSYEFRPETYQDIPEGKGLVIVVENGAFDAAAFIYEEREFEEFTLPSDNRPKRFILMDISVAEDISGYAKFKEAKKESI